MSISPYRLWIRVSIYEIYEDFLYFQIQNLDYRNQYNQNGVESDENDKDYDQVNMILNTLLYLLQLFN